MAGDGDLVWVAVDVLRGTALNGFRGQMDAADLDAILAGVFARPFVLLERVHWLESVWNEAERRSKLKLSVYGRHGSVRWHEGSIYLRPEQIVSVCPLRDCAELLEDEDRFRDED